ncbi:MAG: hypothetical protein WD595_06545 [Waddliaceae bacterium]
MVNRLSEFHDLRSFTENDEIKVSIQENVGAETDNKINQLTLQYLQSFIDRHSDITNMQLGDEHITALLYQSLIVDKKRNDIQILPFSLIEGKDFNHQNLKRYVVLPIPVLNNKHSGLLIFDRHKKTYTYFDSFPLRPLPQNILNICKKKHIIDDSYLRSMPLKQTLQLDFWSCGYHTVENALRYFDKSQDGFIFRKFTFGNDLVNKYKKIYSQFAKVYGKDFEQIELYRRQKIAIRDGLKEVNADTIDHPLKSLYDHILQDKTERPLQEILDEFKVQNQMINSLTEKTIQFLESDEIKKIIPKNLKESINNIEYSVAKSLFENVFSDLINSGVAPGSGMELFLENLKNKKKFIFQMILEQANRNIELNGSSEFIIKNHELKNKVDNILNEIDRLKNHLGSSPNYNGKRPPIIDKKDKDRYFFGISMAAVKEYIRRAIKNAYRPSFFWKLSGYLISVGSDRTAYEQASQAIMRFHMLLQNKDLIKDLYFDKTGRNKLKEFGRLTGGLTWHFKENPWAVENMYMEMIQNMIFGEAFDKAKEAGDNALIEYFKAFNGVCFEDRAKNLEEYLKQNITDLDGAIDYNLSLPFDVSLGNVMKMNNSPKSFYKQLNDDRFFEMDFQDHKINATMRVGLREVHLFVLQQQHFCTMDPYTLNDFLDIEYKIFTQSGDVKSKENFINQLQVRIHQSDELEIEKDALSELFTIEMAEDYITEKFPS